MFIFIAALVACAVAAAIWLRHWNSTEVTAVNLEQQEAVVATMAESASARGRYAKAWKKVFREAVGMMPQSLPRKPRRQYRS